MDSGHRTPGAGPGAGSSSAFSDRKQGHHRRRSSASVTTLSEQRNGNFLSIQPRRANEQLHQPSLSPIPGTPMSHSRSPSPIPGSAWSTPGAGSDNSGRSTPSQPAPSPISWEATKMRYMGTGPYPRTSNHGQGFLRRHMRQLSSSLPQFAAPHHSAMLEKEKANRRRHSNPGNALWARMRNTYIRMGPRLRQRLLIGLVLWLAFHWLYAPLLFRYRRSSWGGGGENFAIVVPANKEGGVMDWKSGRAWAIERDSVRQKQRYIDRWGYEMEIVDMKAKRRYSHEWREGWEKVDLIRAAFKKYPDVEWIWWLDLNTIIMEPYYSLQSHILDHVEDKIYRDINVYNPLNITHPFTDSYLDPDGDGDPQPLDLILTQDCRGFSLDSFLIRRSAWTERLLDMWWDPVLYEQKHSEWKYKEASALEHMYASQPWVRQHVGFLPQRTINSYPNTICANGSGKNDTRFHYDENDRDFVVTIPGCEWSGDCWNWMYNYRQYAYWLNRSWWEKFKEDWVAVAWYKLTGHDVKL